MSLINRQPDRNALLAMHAEHILNTPRHLLHTISAQWEGAFRALWQNPHHTPQELLDAIGTNAAELFALNSQLVAFLLDVTKDRDPETHQYIAKLAATVPPHKTTEDGRVILAE